ncbi:hypothetical protein F4814DRAFT_415375 [Daldinia grandis]|nr:hypothetical protein F4814DRAFT_415375 [Daldinia grandis]
MVNTRASSSTSNSTLASNMASRSSTRSRYPEHFRPVSQPSSNSRFSEQRPFDYVESANPRRTRCGNYPYWGSEADRHQWQRRLVKELVRVKYARLSQTQHPLLTCIRKLAKAEQIELWYRDREMRKAYEKRKKRRENDGRNV